MHHLCCQGRAFVLASDRGTFKYPSSLPSSNTLCATWLVGLQCQVDRRDASPSRVMCILPDKAVIMAELILKLTRPVFEIELSGDALQGTFQEIYQHGTLVKASSVKSPRVIGFLT